MRKRPLDEEEKPTYHERPVLKRRRSEDHGEIFGQEKPDQPTVAPGSPEWKKRRQILWITAGVLLAAGFVISFKHPWLVLLAGLVGGSMATVLSEIPRIDKLKFPYGLVAAWAGTAAIFGLILFLLIPAWHGQAMSYADSVQSVTGLVAEKVGSDFSPSGTAGNVVEPDGEDTPALEEEKPAGLKDEVEEAQALLLKGATQLGDKTAQLINRFDGVMIRIRSFSFLLFLQSLLLAGGLVILSWDLSQPPAEKAGERKWYGRMGDRLLNYVLKSLSWLGTFVLTRLAKGLVMGVLVSVGLLAGGFELAWFIGGIAALFSFFLRPGYQLALLLAFSLVPTAPNLVRAFGGLLGTIIALFFLEKRIHWYTCLLPTLHAGFTPRAVRPKFDMDGGIVGPRHTFWGTVLTLLRISRLLTTLATLAGIGFLAWAILPSYKIEKSQQEELRNATSLIFSGKPEEALDQYTKLEQQYPGHPELLYGKLKAQMEMEDLDGALASAEALAAWAPPAAEDLSLKETVYHHFRGYVFPDYTQAYPGRGYEYILNNREWTSNAETLGILGARLFELDDQSLLACRVLVDKALFDEDAETALTYAEKGLALEPGGTGWHAYKAKAYALQSDWEKVKKACALELERDPDNEEVATLQKWAESMLQ